MRPRSFWSAVLIYGLMWTVLFSIVTIAFMMYATPRIKLTDLLLMVGMNAVGGVFFGLGLGAIHNPVKRTFAYDNADQFRSKFEQVLQTLGFLPLEQAGTTSVYRSKSVRPPLPDIYAKFGPESAEVTGSKHILGRIGKRLKEKKYPSK